MRRVKPFRTLAANVLAPLGIAVLLFLALEGGCRVALRAKTGSWPETRVEAYTKFVEKIGRAYRLHPYLVVTGRPAATLEAAGKIAHFNARGQRATNVRDLPLLKPPGVSRIVCEGGSTTFDLLAPDDASTWPARLGALLASRADVANAGFPGWTSLESLISLEIRDVDLAPDVVIVFAGINDLQPAGHVPFASDYSIGHAEFLPRVVGVSRATLLFEPGTAWNYSNIGIAALGRIIEVVAGQPYDRFLAERIFQPLEMKDTFFFVPPDKTKRVASVYTYEADGLKRVPMSQPKFPAPEGGLLSTAGDMARFHQMLLDKGKLNGQRILSAAAVEAMTSSQTGSMKAGFAPGVGHGFGFEVVREVLGTFRYNSIGSFVKGGAYRTYGWVDPAKDLVGIIFMQRTNGGGDVADEINSFMAMAASAIER